MLVAVAAVVWWALGHPGFETPAQRALRIEAETAAVEAAKPRLYRWRDAEGRLQVTSTPPAGRKYQVVDLEAQENVNVIPMSEAIAPPAQDEAPAR